MALVFGVPANYTDVASVPGPERYLVTNDVWVPVSNRVAALNDGLLPTVMQHIR